MIRSGSVLVTNGMRIQKAQSIRIRIRNTGSRHLRVFCLTNHYHAWPEGAVVIGINDQNSTVLVMILLGLNGTWQCCVTVTIYCGFGSNFWQVPGPISVPAPFLDRKKQFKRFGSATLNVSDRYQSAQKNMFWSCRTWWERKWSLSICTTEHVLILQDLRGAEVIAINEHIRGQIASSPSRKIGNPKSPSLSPARLRCR